MLLPFHLTTPSKLMGIQGLSKLIKQHAPKAIKPRVLQDYRGQCIALDASLAIWQVVMAKAYFGRDHNVNSKKHFVGHVTGILGRTLWLLEYGITPIFVFDGIPPVEKTRTIEARQAVKTRAKERMSKIKHPSDVPSTLLAQSTSVSFEQMEECRELVRLCGVPVVEAPGEAEAQCAEMVKRSCGVVGVATEDMDALTFGAPVLLRGLNSGHRGADNPVLEYHLADVLRGLKLTMEQFIDLCILLGCDYSSKLPGVGPVKAFEAIKKFGSIDALLVAIEEGRAPSILKSTPADLEEFTYAAARRIFENPNVYPVVAGETEQKRKRKREASNIAAKSKSKQPSRARRTHTPPELRVTTSLLPYDKEELQAFLYAAEIDRFIDIDRALGRLKKAHERFA